MLLPLSRGNTAIGSALYILWRCYAAFTVAAVFAVHLHADAGERGAEPGP
jgi:hypothetical protein